eukprot:gnl/Dysnectes_brevis/6131_a9261_387.p1 GENE.gnl/Dysnectes_brevis/6131_a9261_387~~gnl/Dysnectes_brevis/6131_a9261_387.p1  ORF type:complete len:449 (+),score=39.11 gnl/Dysnectes_brevis/6131_a9261_387:193-1539(+)
MTDKLQASLIPRSRAPIDFPPSYRCPLLDISQYNPTGICFPLEVIFSRFTSLLHSPEIGINVRLSLDQDDDSISFTAGDRISGYLWIGVAEHIDVDSITLSLASIELIRYQSGYDLKDLTHDITQNIDLKSLILSPPTHSIASTSTTIKSGSYFFRFQCVIPKEALPTVYYQREIRDPNPLKHVDLPCICASTWLSVDVVTPPPYSKTYRYKRDLLVIPRPRPADQIPAPSWADCPAHAVVSRWFMFRGGGRVHTSVDLPSHIVPAAEVTPLRFTVNNTSKRTVSEVRVSLTSTLMHAAPKTTAQRERLLFDLPLGVTVSPQGHIKGTIHLCPLEMMLAEQDTSPGRTWDLHPSVFLSGVPENELVYRSAVLDHTRLNLLLSLPPVSLAGRGRGRGCRSGVLVVHTVLTLTTVVDGCEDVSVSVPLDIRGGPTVPPSRVRGPLYTLDG